MNLNTKLKIIGCGATHPQRMIMMIYVFLALISYYSE